MQRSFTMVFIIAAMSLSNECVQPAISLSPDSLKHQKTMELADRFVRRALTDTIGYQLLRELSAMGPRLVGSENSMNAIRWAEQKMEKLGIDKITLQSVIVPRWERGNIEEAEIVASGNHKGRKLNVASLGGSVGTSATGITAEVLEINNTEELQIFLLTKNLALLGQVSMETILKQAKKNTSPP